MILKVAWRNIWRNPVRSLVIMTSLAVGMFAGLFSSTFINGWMQQRVRDGIETETSHIKAQTEAFYRWNDFENHFANGPLVAHNMRQLEGIDGASARLVIVSMIASAENATGVRIIGADPQQEQNVVNIHTKIVEGHWFAGVKRSPIVVGQKLAERLNIHLRSKLIITLQDANGNITGGAFRVAGIYKTVNTSFDEAHVWVKYTDLLALTGLPAGTTHEIAIHTTNPISTDKVKTALQGQAPSLHLASWREFSPEFAYIDQMGQIYNYLLVVIILLALGFGIINTMLMVVLERVRELGMLMAVGMNRRNIFSMIMFETILLCVSGGFVGILLGVIATEVTAKTGINLSVWDEGLSEWGYASVIYPQYDFNMVVTIAILVLITGITSAIYPAAKALKLTPSEAIRVI